MLLYIIGSGTATPLFHEIKRDRSFMGFMFLSYILLILMPIGAIVLLTKQWRQLLPGQNMKPPAIAGSAEWLS